MLYKSVATSLCLITEILRRRSYEVLSITYRRRDLVNAGFLSDAIVRDQLNKLAASIVAFKDAKLIHKYCYRISSKQPYFLLLSLTNMRIALDFSEHHNPRDTYSSGSFVLMTAHFRPGRQTI